MSPTYYTLIIRVHQRWRIAFGDYSPKVVRNKFNEYHANGYHLRDLGMLRTPHDQGAIEDAVREINAECGNKATVH